MGKRVRDVSNLEPLVVGKMANAVVHFESTAQLIGEGRLKPQSRSNTYAEIIGEARDPQSESRGRHEPLNDSEDNRQNEQSVRSDRAIVGMTAPSEPHPTGKRIPADDNAEQVTSVSI